MIILVASGSFSCHRFLVSWSQYHRIRSSEGYIYTLTWALSFVWINYVVFLGANGLSKVAFRWGEREKTGKYMMNYGEGKILANQAKINATEDGELREKNQK